MKKKTNRQLLEEILEILKKPEREKQLKQRCSACQGSGYSHSCGRSSYL